MDHRIQQLQYHPLTLVKKQATKTNGAKPFKELFESAVVQETGIKISKHAKQRLAERNISITETKWNELQAKLVEARQKGVQESLVVMDNAALIVDAKSETVITAMNREEAASQIFTNINGTILLDN